MNHVGGAKKSPSDVVSYICFYLTVIKNRLIGFKCGKSCIFFGNGQLLEIRYEEESALEFISAFVVYKQILASLWHFLICWSHTAAVQCCCNLV